jgi:hypothetical protein
LSLQRRNQALWISYLKAGIFASSIIKERRYWLPGAAMDDRMNGKPLDTTDSLRGNMDGKNYDLSIMKDQEYNMKLNFWYGRLLRIGQNSET